MKILQHHECIFRCRTTKEAEHTAYIFRIMTKEENYPMDIYVRYGDEPTVRFVWCGDSTVVMLLKCVWFGLKHDAKAMLRKLKRRFKI